MTEHPASASSPHRDPPSGGRGGRANAPQSSPNAARGGGGGRGGGRSGPHHRHQHHHQHPPNQHHPGRDPAGGRRLYDPQNPRQQVQPHPVSLHQQSGLPHGHVPAYLCGSASLVEELDARLLVVLRDGRHLVGTLSSYDQFSNLVLEDTVERRYVRDPDAQQLWYADVPLGLYVVRGESVVLMGRTMPHNVVGTPLELDELDAKRKAVAAAAYSSAEPELDWDVDADLVA